MTTQYLIVFIIIAGSVGWIIYKLLFKSGKKSSGSCCGCALSDNCNKPKAREERKKRKKEEI